MALQFHFQGKTVENQRCRGMLLLRCGIVIPCPDMKTAYSEEADSRSAESPRPKLVLLEREPADGRELVNALSRRFEVRSTASVEECVRWLRSFRPATVLVEAGDLVLGRWQGDRAAC